MAACSNLDMAALEDLALAKQTEQEVRFRQRNEADAPKDPPKKIFSKSRQTVHYLVVSVKIVMFLLVLATLVASKVSITTMLAHLRSMTAGINTPAATVVKAQHKSAVGLYWQLLFILMVPNTITWVRALFNGVIGKSSSQPWPTFWAFLGVSDLLQIHVNY